MTQPNFLVISPVPLHDNVGGVRLRGYPLVQSLQRLGKVELLCFDDGNGDPGDERLPSPPGQWERILSPTPSIIRCFQSASFHQKVAEKSKGCRACFGLGLQMAQYQSSLAPGVPFMLDNYNVETFILKGLADDRRGLKRLYWLFQAFKLFLWERRALRRATGVMAISPRDARQFQRWAPETPVSLVPPGLIFLPKMPGEAVPGRLCFTGALDWHVNVEACNWMARTVLPKIRKKRKDAHLQIVGRRPGPEVSTLATLEGVSVHADVPDIRTYLSEAALAVAPLRFASGSQNKILEALANGRLVVTTRPASDGLELLPGTHLLVADNEDQFIEHCLWALDHPVQAAEMAEAGRAWVTRHYSIERHAADIAALVQGLDALRGG